jgi:hypothetical protein
MKRTLKIISLSLISIQLFGTAQAPDILCFNGDTLMLFTNPLESLFDDVNKRPASYFGDKIGCLATYCARGYIGHWRLENDSLFLVSIKSCCYNKDNIEANLNALFPERTKNKKVYADWFSGSLISPYGKLLYQFNDGYFSIYESELEFSILNGQLIDIKSLDNSKTKKSKYTENQSLLKEYIEGNIIMENLPDRDTIKRCVHVSIFSTHENATIDSVAVVRGVNELYDNEAIRVVKSIPEWDVIYRHGEKVEQFWMIPINFDLTNNY